MTKKIEVKDTYHKTCGNCGIDFTTDKAIKKYCSGRCAVKVANDKRGDGPDKNVKKISKAEIIAEVVKIVSNSKPHLVIPKYRKPFHGRVSESAVLLLSDIHCGKKNKFLNQDTGLLEVTYNMEIMKKEFANLIQGIEEINTLLAPSYNIEDLYIYGLGDWVDNDQIFDGQKFLIEFGVGKQVFVLAQIMKELILYFLKIYKRVHLVGLVGNHGRMTAKRAAAPVYNNFDYMTYKVIEAMLSGEKRVEFIIPESNFIIHNIYKWRYRLQHGENVKSWAGIPYYGMARRGRAVQTEIPADMDFQGHLHSLREMPIGSKCKAIINGGWVPKDVAAWDWFGEISVAEQYFFGVNPKRPRTWAFPLDIGCK